jgi:hypothetical protein
MELVEGRSVGELEAQLAHIPGRYGVRLVVTDLCDPFKTFAAASSPTPRSSPTNFTFLRLLVPGIGASETTDSDS